ncbi:hypothetical protein HJFPF1_07240 [Paramyrothecium foliicola]|nr:hypothetical protein HJFPF1_07240 [Paramyrothecium foliicola]
MAISQGYCSTCQRLFEQAKNPHLFPDVANLLSDKGYLHNNPWGVGCLMCEDLRQLAGILDTAQKGSTHLLLKAVAEEDDPAAQFFPLRPPIANLSDTRVFEALRSSLKKCQESHGHCQPSIGIPILPRRVVAVQQGQEHKISVYEPAAGQKGEYVTLSYCWGTERTFRATTENISALKTGIDISVLPQTLQDAIEVTRRLGYNYLWADALCILQDSLSDKDREIEHMGDIYRHAVVTIAAASALGSHEGFLRGQRQPFKSLKTVFPLGGSKEGTIFLTAKPKPMDINQLPLGRRGWAFQEFFLSPRLIIYTLEEILWSCKETKLVPLKESVAVYLDTITQLPSSLDDANENPLPPFISQPQVPDYEIISQQISALLDSTVRWDTLHTLTQFRKQCSLWKSIVSQYTARALTDPEDRLRALQGVVGHLQQVWQTKHHFGLWKNAWPELLAWYRVGPSSPSLRQLHRAPSWSWASLDSAVGFLRTSEVMGCYEVGWGQFNTTKERSARFTGVTLSFQGRVVPFEELDSPAEQTIMFDYEDEPHLNMFFVPLGRETFPDERIFGGWDGEDNQIFVYSLVVSQIRETLYQRLGAARTVLTKERWLKLVEEHPMQDVKL